MVRHKIVIVGGGTAGWMTAAALSNQFDAKEIEITLVESDAIGTVGVGEATIPHLRYFNRRLGIDEREFVRATNATYKLGIELINWSAQPSSYVHPFGDFGQSVSGHEFYLAWLAYKKFNPQANFSKCSTAVMAALNNKFSYPKSNDQQWQGFSYAFHLDAIKYAHYLRSYAQNKGVVRVEGLIESVQLDDAGNIGSLRLQSEQIIAGDLFIDCSGFRALLMEQALKVEFDDWSHWLLCDRAIAMPAQGDGVFKPYTQAEAMHCGWRWEIPLINRTGNGLVYSSEHMSDAAAYEYLASKIKGQALANPNHIRFKAGRRRVCWERNCVAIGLASGFLEPLESTSIYLIQLGIMKLLELYSPSGANVQAKQEFNAVMGLEYERVRDFIIAHYSLANRADSEFWRHCSNMELPASLQERLDIYRTTGLIDTYDVGLFKTPSWAAMLIGQSCLPNNLPEPISNLDPMALQRFMAGLEHIVADYVQTMPEHIEFLRHHGETGEVPPSELNFYGVFS